jgi:hypothetical protein
MQKQGRSSDAGADLLTVYIGGSKAVNQTANTGSFTYGDQSFFMIANNNTPTTYSWPTQGAAPAGIISRLQRQWLVQKRNFTNTDLSLEFDLSTLTSPISASDLRLLIDNDGNFTDATVVGTPTATITLNSGVVTVTLPASSFGASSYITLASASAASALPVQLGNFSAVCKNNKVQLAWTKLSTAASSYDIERSSDGHGFTAIATVSSATAGTQSFSWTDPSSLSGISYYRLKAIDETGFATYSPIAIVNGCSIDNTHLVSDQASGQSTLVIQLQQSATVDISLFDVLGHRLELSGLTGKHALQQGYYRLPVAQQSLSSGLYLLSVTINGNKNVYRIVQP